MVEIDSFTGMSSKRFVVIFVLALAALLLAFTLMVHWAGSILPQEDEVITTQDAAARIERGEIERILIQEQGQNIFLYLPDEPRPLYIRLELGESFTETMQSLGVDAVDIPPVTEEE
ncbi:hypothetical protein GC175_18865 [bacterium]|nr:hypothetical protein [bacterium]